MTCGFPQYYEWVENYCSQLFYVNVINSVRQTEIHTVEPSSDEVEIHLILLDSSRIYPSNR